MQDCGARSDYSRTRRIETTRRQTGSCATRTLDSVDVSPDKTGHNVLLRMNAFTQIEIEQARQAEVMKTMDANPERPLAQFVEKMAQPKLSLLR